MKTYRVKVLTVGKMKVDKSILTRGTGCAVSLDIPVRVLAVEGDGVKMLVDTGIADDAADSVKIEGVEILKPEEGQNMEAALKAAGWKAEDVNMVVNTHLHFDTCGNNKMFPDAKLFVQKKEWQYALHPSMNQTEYYQNTLLSNSAGCGCGMQLVDGEYEIAEGLILLPTPGHTRGHQSVIINTEEGVVCYAGHAVNLMENLNDNIIGNILDDTRQSFESMEWIRRTSRYVIPGFDSRIPAFSENGFPSSHE